MPTGADAGDEELDAELLAALGSVKQAPQGVMSEEEMDRMVDVIYVFCFVWSFGCNLDDGSRAKFNDFVSALLSPLVRAAGVCTCALPPPPSPSGADPRGHMHRGRHRGHTLEAPTLPSRPCGAPLPAALPHVVPPRAGRVMHACV